MGLWSKKSIARLQAEAAAEGQEVTLRRALGALNLTMLGIGAIIGAGIFVLTGTAAAQYAGPAIVLSFILAGLGCLFAGLCYAEFSAMIPIAGSAYTYGYATLGELIAWIIGWDLILEYLFGAATVAVGWSGYFVAFVGELGLKLPTQWTQAPLNVVGTHTLVRNLMCVSPDGSAVAATNGACAAGSVLTPGMINLPAIVLVALMSTLLVIGIKESASFNNVIVFIKVAIVIAVIGFGFVYVNTANWHPFIPTNTGEFGHYGWSGIARGAAVVFFAYIGFDAVSTAAQEARNPQKDMPIGILSSLAICTVLYILMALVMTGLAHYTELNVPHPVFVAIDKAGPALHWLTYFINIGAILGLASVVLVMLMGQPRIFFSMSRDGLLPATFGKVHRKFQTPYVTTIVTGVVAAIVAGLFPIALLGELVSIGTLLAFVIVCFGVMILRYTRPNIPRPFRTPMVPAVPILGILICGYMMYTLPPDTWLRLIVWMAIGLVIYFTYSIRHSRVAQLPPEPATGD
ncbi:MAG TPA: amino acid permease [Gemmatimonadaceae bacterium]|jgi:basic amino acid/polyamine antiporter, APA family|nr:amino acid permease [Gemmatimonadaceae bacterium]